MTIKCNWNALTCTHKTKNGNCKIAGKSNQFCQLDYVKIEIQKNKEQLSKFLEKEQPFKHEELEIFSLPYGYHVYEFVLEAQKINRNKK